MNMKVTINEIKKSCPYLSTNKARLVRTMMLSEGYALVNAVEVVMDGAVSFLTKEERVKYPGFIYKWNKA